MKTDTGRKKGSLSLLLLCLFSLTHAAAGLPHSAEQFVLIGDDVTVSCGVCPIEPCSSVNWSVMGQFHSVSMVAKDGVVVAPYTHRFGLLKDCSLKINHLIQDDARMYLCHSNKINSSVSLHTVELTENSRKNDTIELQCFLNTYQGHKSCFNRGIRIKWTTEHDALLSGKRFDIENPSECFSKLLITTKPTDHQRKWKCSVYQNETLKASITHVTTVRDGIEEVFASVGDSVSLSCHNTSSLGVGGSVEWAAGGEALSDRSPSLFIGKVSALHAGEYRCSDSADRQRVFNRVRLHTLEVRAASGGRDLALTCVLTCAAECEKDSSLAWRGGGTDGRQNTSGSVRGALENRLVLPGSPAPADDLTCLVLVDGVVMASRKWHANDPLWTPAWLLLPLALLLGLAAAGIYVHRRRSPNKESGDAQLDVGLAHIYEVCQEENDTPKPPQEETADSFYNLLQPVN